MKLIALRVWLTAVLLLTLLGICIATCSILLIIADISPVLLSVIVWGGSAVFCYFLVGLFMKEAILEDGDE